MKLLTYLIISIALIGIQASPSMAETFLDDDYKKQTPVTNQQVAQFVQSCSSNRDERMSAKTQNIFCECTSFGYKDHITQEDLQRLANGTEEEKRAMINKMVIYMYSPCMEFPVRDLVFNKCTKDAYQAGKKICACMADEMSQYMAKRAQAELKGILEKNPHIYDPIEAITSSKSYEAKEKRIVLECIQQNFKK